MKKNETNNNVVEQDNTIYLEREFVKSNGKEYANYFVRGLFKVKGIQKEMKIRMDVPRNDVTMYDVLDMVFGDRSKVELIKIKKINRDSTGRKTTTYRYEVENEDGDLRARVVPNGDSNTALLDKLYKDLEKEEIVEDDEVETTTN